MEDSSGGTFMCRVCLERDSPSTTSIPIFETIGSPDPEVYSKLCLCIGEKQIEDIDGYPRHICKLCHITLNTTVKFIERFNESTKVLSKCKEQIVKDETPEYLDFEELEDNDLLPDFNEIDDDADGDENNIEHTLQPVKLKKEGVAEESNITEIESIQSKEDIDIIKESHDKEMIKESNVSSTDLGDQDNCTKLTFSNFTVEWVPPPTKKIVHLKRVNFVIEIDEPTPPKQKKCKSKKEKIRKIKKVEVEGKKAKVGEGKARNVEETKKAKRKAKSEETAKEVDGKSKKIIRIAKVEKLVINNESAKRGKVIEKVENKREKKLTESKENKTKRHLCDNCGAKFEGPSHLRSHIQNMHSTRERLQCEQCPAVFFGNSNLQRHIRAIHMPKRHICSVCGKAYYYLARLKKHVREVHDNIRPKVQCHLCDRQFVGNVSRETHIRAVHTGERPEICTFCNKRFTHKVYLREHMRLHTGEKPYSCLVCGKAYPARSYLKSHIKYNHRVSQLDEEIITKLKTSTMDYFKIMKP